MTDASTTSFAARTNRSQRAITVDNFMRKALRVNDPRNPDQIANALLSRYPEEADRDRREREGLSYASPGAQGRLPVMAQLGSVEIETARSNLERDIQTLTTHSTLKDVSIELTGWGRAARKTASDGLASARLAIDATSHDGALAARRTLGEYARLARYLGILFDGSCEEFRDFAQSCDVLGALILVGIGDGLAAGGVTRSAALVRVAAGELQARRSAVISSLRALNGTLESSLSQENYPRGIVGYQALLRALESGGQADLRALLEENTLGEAMDELTDLTHGGNVANLRELSTTSSILVHRFTRLVQYAEAAARPLPNGVDPATVGTTESPPLLGLAAALQLFVDAFAIVGGNRLLYLARPPILAYGLYDNAGDLVSQRLIALTSARGQLAQAIDCAACCGCTAEDLRTAALFDFVVSLVDRAIDLLAVGTDPDGLGGSERRAVAAGVFALYAVDFTKNGLNGITFRTPGPAIIDSVQAIARATLGPFTQQLSPPQLDPQLSAQVVNDLIIAHNSELQTEVLVRRLAPSCGQEALFNLPDQGVTPVQLVSVIRLALRTVVRVFNPTAVFDRPLVIDLPQTSPRSGDMMVNNSANPAHMNV
jgi:hypothetical protein